MGTRPQLDMTPDAIESFVASMTTCVLSTLDRHGMPHAVTMYFVPSASEIHMWTYRKSQKARNLTRDPRCAVLIEGGEPYVDTKGVLVRGSAVLVEEYDAIADIGRRIYEHCFLPRLGVAYEDGPRADIERQAHKRVGIVLPMKDAASWDHAKEGVGGNQ